MNIADIPEFVASENLATQLVYKYIIVSVTNADKAEKSLIRVTRPHIDHAKTLEVLRAELQGFELNPKGGGRIQFRPDNKDRINVFGRSVDLGNDVSRDVTVRILKRAYPGFEVHIPDEASLR